LGNAIALQFDGYNNVADDVKFRYLITSTTT